MGARVAVFDHPSFAVTDSKGRFEVPNLPPGKHTLEVWPVRCSPVAREVEVGSDGRGSADFQLELKEGRTPPASGTWYR